MSAADLWLLHFICFIAALSCPGSGEPGGYRWAAVHFLEKHEGNLSNGKSGASDWHLPVIKSFQVTIDTGAQCL